MAKADYRLRHEWKPKSERLETADDARRTRVPRDRDLKLMVDGSDAGDLLPSSYFNSLCLPKHRGGVYMQTPSYRKKQMSQPAAAAVGSDLVCT